MARNIALSLTINGVKENISSINQLEDTIKSLEDQLKSVEIGSQEFNRLSAEIRQANNVFEDFNQTIQGQNLQDRIGSFAAVGESVVGSFAAAQAAIGLFGVESERVAEAATQAQNLLTVALGARSVAEGLVEVKTVAQTIATRASALAAGTANTAMKALYTTLAANPYTAIAIAIGAVVTGLIALTNRTEEVVDINKELVKSQSEEARALKDKLFILKQENGLRNLQARTIKELVDEYPGFNAFLDEENRLNEEGVRFLELKIRQYELEAQARIITQRLAENSIRILEIEATSLLENVSIWEQAWSIIRSGGNAYEAITNATARAAENQRNAVNEIIEENERWRIKLVEIYEETDSLIDQSEEFDKVLGAQERAERRLREERERAKQELEDYLNGYKSGTQTIIDFSAELRILDDVLRKYNDALKQLGEIEVSAKIVDDLQAIQDARKTAAEELVTGVEQTRRQLAEIFSVEELPEDEFFTLFNEFRDQLETVFGRASFEYVNYAKTIIKQNKDLSQEQQKALLTIADAYQQIQDQVYEIPGLADAIQQIKDVGIVYDELSDRADNTYDGFQAFVEIIGDVAASLNEYDVDIRRTAEGLFETYTPEFDVAEAKQNADNYLNQLKDLLFEPYVKSALEAKLEAQKALLLDPTLSQQERGQINAFITRINDALTDLTDKSKLAAVLTTAQLTEIKDKVGEAVDSVVDFALNIGTAEDEVFRINKKVIELTNNLKSNTQELTDAINSILISNIDSVFNQISTLRTRAQREEEDFIKSVKDDVEGLQEFRENLIKKGFNVESQTYDQLLDAYIEYKRKEKEVADQSAADRIAANQKVFDDITLGFDLFGQTLSEISALSNESIQTDLEGLTVKEKLLLDQIVGDSEEANKKRLEIQEEYQNKRKVLEKRQTIQSLQFQKAESISNAALAIVRTLAELGPILGPVFSAVIAGLTAVQVSTIQTQIQNARALRRGGLIYSSGGLLSGPSHEEGGIPLAQAGLIVEGQESVINRQSTINYRDMLSTINQAGGGRPLVVNNFDDSRILEALAEQKKMPIRTYVLESEITNSQGISRRLEDLSKI